MGEREAEVDGYFCFEAKGRLFQKREGARKEKGRDVLLSREEKMFVDEQVGQTKEEW